MAKVKLLAFLVCERVTRDSDGKVTVHDIFDRIVLPQFPVPYGKDEAFSVYYKVDALQPCVVSLCVIDPQGNLVPTGSWGDPIKEAGLTQSLWSLTHSMFRTPGRYTLRFDQRDDIDPSDPGLPGPLEPDFKAKEGHQGEAAQILATAPLILDEGKLK